jgi:hypothetical protein
MAVDERKTTLKRVGRQVNFAVEDGIVHCLKASGSACWMPRRSVVRRIDKSIKSDDC